MFKAMGIKSVGGCRELDPIGDLGMPMKMIFALVNFATHIDAFLLRPI